MRLRTLCSSLFLTLFAAPTAHALDDSCDAFGSLEWPGSIHDGDTVFYGGQRSSGMGYSVAHGDFNGDGEVDLAVGAPGDRTNGRRAGAVHIFFGPLQIGGDVEAADADVTFAGPGPNYQAGWDVASLGDLDGDGRDDLGIGSLSALGTAHPAGVAWVVYGSTGWSGVLDLSTDADVTLVGALDGDAFGSTIVGVGDVTGDGAMDVAIGAPDASNTFREAGAVYVYDDVGLGVRPTSDAIATVDGATEFASLGQAIAGLGDIDGDGVDDIGFGAPLDRSTGSRSGAAYVFRGGLGLAGPLAPSDAYIGLRGRISDRVGASLSAAGDIDNDGLADFWVGAQNWGGTRRGAAYLFLGRATGLGVVNAEAHYESRIIGYDAADFFGTSVAGNGDVNGDGVLDVVVGARQADGSVGAYTGAAWVLYGPFQTTQTAQLTGAHWGQRRYASAGIDVSMVPDFNGDGFDEVLVSAWRDNFKGVSRTGIVSMFMGGEDVEDEAPWFVDSDGDGWGDPTTALNACTQPAGRTALGGDCNDSDPAYHPYAIELDCLDLTDYNCDGSVGVADSDGDGIQSCLGDCDDNDAEVYPGNVESCFDNKDNDCDGAIDDSSSFDAQTFYPDADGDLYGDILLGVLACEPPSTFLASVVVVGGDCDDTEPLINPDTPEVCDTLDNDCDGDIDEPDALDASPFYADGDADGFGDLYALEYACNQPAGTVTNSEDCDDTEVNISPSGNEVCDAVDNDCDGRFYLGGPIEASTRAALKILSERTNDDFGASIAFTPDFSGDGREEIIFGAPSSEIAGEDAGAVYIRYGSPTAGVVDLQTFRTDDTPFYDVRILPQRARGDFGAQVAGGDFNGDGIGDVAVGAPRESRPTSNQGAVYVYYGPFDGELVSEEADVIWNGSGGGTFFGTTVVAADIDGDGNDDLLVGARRDSLVGSRRGAVYVFYGDSAAFDIGRADVLASAVLTGAGDGDELGRAIAAGDFDGDGETDLALGAPEAGLLDNGYVDLVLGTGSRFAGTLATSLRITDVRTNDGLGRSLANIGDLNDDGIDDLAVGTRFERLHIVYGGALVADDIQVIGDVRVDGTIDLNLGRLLAAAGDLNDDGVADFLFGATGDNTGGVDAGAVYLLYGANDLPAVISVTEIESFGRVEDGTVFPTWSAQNIGGFEGASIYGSEDAATFGYGFAGAHDLNGDGVDDLLISARGPSGGRSYVVGIYGGTYGTDYDVQGDATDLAASFVDYIYDLDLDGHGDDLPRLFSSCPMHAPINFDDPDNPVIAALVMPAPADDCDDADPQVYTGANEIPGDGIDQDCDGADQLAFCNDNDRFEDNDDLSSAAAVGDSFNGGLEVCASDEDYFSVDVSAGDTLTVTIEFRHSRGDLDLELVDGFGGELKASRTAADQEKVTFTSAVDQTVYAHIALSPLDLTSSGNDYDMDVAIIPAQGACTDADAYEDNDFQGEAATVPAGAYTGLEMCFGDLDYYAVELLPFETLRVEVDFAHAEGDIDLSLHDGFGRILARSASLRNTEIIRYTSSESEVVYVRAYLCCGDPLAPGAPYDMEIQVAPVVCDAADLFEDADDAASAQALMAGSFADLELCPGDEDWYLLTLNDGDTLTLGADFRHEDGNIDMELLDSGSNLIASATSLDDDETLTFTSVADATYLVRVLLAGGDANEPGNAYDLDVGINGTNPDCTDGDIFEDNEVFASATPLTDGDYTSLELCMDDLDFYTIDLQAGDEVTIVATFDARDGDIDMTLLSAGGAVLSRATGSSNAEVMVYTAGAAETIYVRVYLCCGDPGAGGSPYDLSIDVTSCSDTDTLEPNNSPLAPAAIMAGTTSDLRLCPTTEDFYSVDVLDGQVLTVDLLYSVGEGDLDLELIDEDGVTSLATAETATDNERLVYTATADATLVVHVYSDGLDAGAVGSDYDLALSIVDPPPPCFDTDAYEDNDDFASKAALTVGSYTGLEICADDQDFYSIALLAGDTLTASATFVNAEGNLDLAILSPFGSTLATASGSGNSESASYTAAIDETVGVRVYMCCGDPGAAGNDYDLTLSTTSNVCVDADSRENNDTQGDAVALGTGTTVDMQLCVTDEDWYAIDLAAGETAVVSLAFANAGGNVELQLVDSVGTVLGTSDGFGDSERVVYSAAGAETIYARVWLSGSDTGVPGNTYDITVSIAGLNPTCVDSDASEPNETQGAAALLEEGAYGALQICAVTDDWYEIELFTGDTIDITVTYQAAEGDIDLELIDAFGFVVATAATAGDVESISYTTGDAGSVYLHASLCCGDPGAPGSLYGIDVRITGDPTVPGANCDDEDVYEPNDALAEAAAVTFDNYTGLQHCLSQEDYYQVDVTAGDVISARIDFGNAEGNLDLYVYDATGALLGQSTRTNRNYEKVSFAAASSQTVFVRVYMASDAGISGTIYSLDLDSTTPPPSCAAADAYENNDSLGAAAAFAPGTALALELCSNDADWFAHTLTGGDTLTVDVDFVHANDDIDLELYDAGGNLLTASQTDTDGESLTYTAAVSETVYSRVFLCCGDLGALGATYNITSTVDVGVCADADSNEDNDTFVTATAIVPGSVSSQEACAVDDDIYSFSANAGDAVVVDLYFTHAEGDLSVQFFNSSFAAVTSVADTRTDNEKLAFAAPSTGTYYMRVQLGRDVDLPGTTYDFDLSVTPPPPSCVDADSYENNDTRSTAALLPLGNTSGYELCMGDDDYFAYAMAAGDTISVGASFLHAEGDIELRLVTSGGSVLASSSGNTNSEALAYTASTARTVYLRVYICCGDPGVLGNNYSLSVTVTECTDVDVFEDNDDLASAAILSNASYPGLMTCGNDPDFFSVDLLAGEKMDAVLNYNTSESRIYLRMYNSSGTQIGVDTSGDSPRILSRIAPADETIYLKAELVNDYINPGGGYSLTIDISPPCSDDDVYEDNDSLATTTATLTTGFYTNLEVCSNDEDYYAVVLGQGDTLDVDVIFDTAEGDIDLRLYNAGGTLLRSATGGGNKTLTYFAYDAETVYLRMNLQSDAGDLGHQYSTTVSVSPAGPCVDTDSYEDNDTRAGAPLVGEINQGSITICPDDEDFYAIDLGTSDTLLIDVSFASNEGDLDIELLDGSGAVLAASSGTGGGESLTFPSTAAQRVYLHVYQTSDSGLNGHSYNLSLLVPAAPNGDCIDDLFENNDSQASPTTLVQGHRYELRSCVGDNDWYRYYLATGEKLTVEAFFDNLDANLDMRLYAANGTQLNSSTSNTNNELLAYTATGAGYVYLRTYIASGDLFAPGLTYSLDMAVTGPNTCVDDAAEDNDTLATATTRVEALYEDYKLCPDDDDFHRIYLRDDETLTVTATFVGAEGNVDLELQDATGAVLDSSFTATGNTESIVYTMPSAGYVYTRTFLEGLDTGDPGANYTLTWVIAGPDYCTDDDSEPNDSTASATTLVESYYRTFAHCEGGEDFFRVYMLEDEIITINVGFSHADGNIDIELLDSAGIARDAGETETDNEVVTYQATANGYIFLRSYLNGVDTGDTGTYYDIRVTLSGPTDCGDDDWEDDDELALASTLVEATYYRLRNCNDDDDWFRVYLLTGETITFDANILAGDGDLALEMTDPAGVVLDTSNSAGNERVMHTAPAAGYVYMHTWQTGADDGLQGIEYNVSVKVDGPSDCSSDAYEINDTLAAADTLWEASYPNVKLCTGDVDYFRVYATTGETVNVTINFPHSSGDVQLELRDAADGVLRASEGVGNSESVSYTTLADGYVYLYIYLNGADTGPLGQEYDIIVDILGHDNCTDDIFEGNDTFATATVLDEDKTWNLKKCTGNDDDWFRVNLVANDTITYTVDHAHAEGDLQLELYDASETLVGSSNSATDDETVTYTSASGGYVYARVTRNGGDTGALGQQYALDVAVTGSTRSGGGSRTTSTCTEDIYEPNQSTGQATLITEGTYNDMMMCGSNVEYYRFVAQPYENISISLLFSDPDGNLQLQLRNSGNSTLASATTSSNNEYVSYYNSSSSAQTYYIYVYLSGADSGSPGIPYSLVMSHTGSQICTDDRYEQNDSTSTATVVDEGRYVGMNSCTGDSDYYRFTLGRFESLNASILFTDADGNLQFELRNASNSVLATSTTSSDNEYISYYNSSNSTQTYYLRVYMSGADPGVPGTPYELVLDIDGASYCTDDDNEPNNNTSGATPIEEGFYEGLLVCTGNVDYYRFTAAPGETFNVAMLFSDVDGNLQLQLRNSGNSLLVSASSSSDNEYITYTNTSASTQTYYLYVYMSGADPGVLGVSYSLTMTNSGPRYCVDGDEEPNNSTSQAVFLEEGTYRDFTMCPSNVDYYRFVLAAGEQLQVSLLFTDTDGDLQLQLRNSGNSTLVSSTSSTNNEYITYTNTSASAQTYYYYVYMSGADTLDPGVQYDITTVVNGPNYCRDDDNEPDNSTSAATVIDEGYHAGMWMCPSSVDYYRFTLAPGERLDMSLYFIDTDYNLQMQLRNSGNSTLVSATSSTNNEYITYTNTATSTQTYYAYIYTSGSDTGGQGIPYDLQLQMSGRSYCIDDDYESNNSTSSATVIDEGYYANLQVCPGNVDYYRFVLLPYETASMSLLFIDTDYDLQLQLRNAGNSTLVSATSSTNNEYITYTNTSSSAQTFYWYVYTSGSDTQEPGVTYEMNFQITGPQSCVDDFYEPNDSTSQAPLMAPETYANLQMCEDTVEYYRFTALAGERINLTAIFTDTEGNIQMQLRNSGNSTLVSATSSSNNEFISYTASYTGTYYLYLYRSGGDFGTPGQAYDLVIDIQPPALSQCIDDLLEPNDDLVDAVPLLDGETAQLALCGDDEDYYVFDVIDGELLDIEAAFFEAEGDLVMELVDVDFNQLAWSTGANGLQTLSYLSTEDEAVFLRVFAGRNGISVGGADYLLDVQRGRPDMMDTGF